MSLDIRSIDQATAVCCTGLRHRDGRWSLPFSALVVAVVALPVALAADALTVSQHNRTFSPDQLQLARGSTVKIVNDDKVTHHVYVDAPGMKFDSGAQSVGSSVELRFDAAGTFDVLCAIHPTMHLQVTVK